MKQELISGFVLIWTKIQTKSKQYKFIFQICFITFAILIIAYVSSFTNISRFDARIKVDGKKYDIAPYKHIPLKKILQLKQINLSKQDLISANLEKPLTPLKKVTITRVKTKNNTVVEKIPFRMTWSRRYNANLRKTELQKGIEKTITKFVKDTFHDGEFFSRQILKERTVSKEYYRLVLLTKDNKIEKIYDLSKTKRRHMVATAYYPGDPLAWGDGTVTFLGQKMQRGIIAVDPKVIPLKTRLFVSGYGYGYAGDTGNMIIGDRVDLGVNNAKEEKSWMFRDVIVYILEPSDKY